MKKSNEKQKINYEVEVTRAKEIKAGTVVFDMIANGVTIYSCFYKEYKTKDGKDGTLISFPSQKGNDGKYYSHAWFPVSNEVKELIIKQLEDLV